MTQQNQNTSIWTGKQRDLAYTIFDKNDALADLTGATFSYTIKHLGGIITIVPTVDIPTAVVSFSILASHSTVLAAGQDVYLQLQVTKGGVPYPPVAIGKAPVYQSDG